MCHISFVSNTGGIWIEKFVKNYRERLLKQSQSCCRYREDLDQQTYLRFLSKLESVRKTWVGQPSHLVRVVAFLLNILFLLFCYLTQPSDESFCFLLFCKTWVIQPSPHCSGRHFRTKLMSRYIGAGQNDRFDVRIQEVVSKVQNPGGFLRKNVF